MQKVISLNSLDDIYAYLEKDISHYIYEAQIESFESFDNFSLCAFDWYDIQDENISFSKIIIYMDKEDIFIICEDQRSYIYFDNVFKSLNDKELNNEDLLCNIFIKLFKGDMDYLDRYEAKINLDVEKILAGNLENATEEILLKRQELLRLKHYYEQIDMIFDEIALANDKFISKATLRRLNILGARTDRYLNKVYNLQEIVSQMLDTYHAELSIQQNNLMKFFTVITSIFLPLTLIVGWYGMNFKYMPELNWILSYPLIILLSILIIIIMLWYFKHKKWL